MYYISSEGYPTVESLKKVGGIYVITNTETKNRVHQYVGHSTDLYKRYKSHSGRLKNKKHINQHMQNSYNKYGESSFTFEILEFVERAKYLIIRESFWIEELGGVGLLFNACAPIETDSNKHIGSHFDKSVINNLKRLKNTELEYLTLVY